MNLLFCGDDGIKDGVLVAILSLLMNGQKRYDVKSGKMVVDEKMPLPIYNIYIATINYENVKPFRIEVADYLDKLVKKYNPRSSVKLIDATDVFVKNLPKKNMGSYFTPCSMLRLFADKMPELDKCDRILYMDYDVVCRGDISELYDTDMQGIEAAGVLDIYGRRWYHYNGLVKRGVKDTAVVDARVPSEREWSFLKQDYMNSGVMLFNMTECRKTKMLERAAKLCAEKWMMLADQAALNKVIRRRKLMPRKYNEQEERPRKDTVLHHFSNNFKFWPYFRVQKVKPFEIEKIHEVLNITEYDDILEKYIELKSNL
ncbi:glycosyltransferase family 8 protein [Candidatus Saccharibacteria bacterium]|nr:glycosyltransferase family 8 protein [Candidatus Saccharibacteria bacterium]